VIRILSGRNWGTSLTQSQTLGELMGRYLRNAIAVASLVSLLGCGGGALPTAPSGSSRSSAAAAPEEPTTPAVRGGVQGQGAAQQSSTGVLND
jgi:hypothetical protein